MLILIFPAALTAQEESGEEPAAAPESGDDIELDETSEVDETETPPPVTGGEPPPYRGSSVSLTNQATAYSFNQDADLTYNPYYAIGLGIAPRWYFADWFAISASFSLDLELTNSDWTREKNEIYPSDVNIRFMFPVSLEDNWSLSPSLGVAIPTSKGSETATLITSLSPKISAAKTWPEALEGITLSAGIGYTQYFHESKTPKYDAIPNQGCRNEWSPSCAGLLYGAGTNPMFSIPTNAGISLGLVDTLSFSFNFGYTFMYKHAIGDEKTPLPQGGSGNGINPDALESSFDENEELQSGDRDVHINTYGFDLSYLPIKWLGLSLGSITSGNQLGQDSTYRAPFFNRYTMVYLSFNFLIEGMI